jgi:hypothetical protein
MKIFVFAYDRYETMTTSKMLEAEQIEHTVLCHTQEAANLFTANGTTTTQRLHITNKPKGLAYQRNSALDLMSEGEWALFLVDDLKAVTELRNHDRVLDATIPITQDNQSHYAERFKHQITMQQFIQRAEQLAELCDKHKAYLGGFAQIDNALFRKKHWSINVWADGRALVVKKSHTLFDENVQAIDDLCFTALNIKTFGIVIVNQWVLPDCKRYGAGGYGSIKDRTEQKKQEIAYMVKTFPELIAIKDKANHEYGSHAVLRQRKKPKIKIGR